MLSKLLIAAVLFAPQGQDPQAPPPSNVIKQTFGTATQRGSFEIVFDRRGGAIWSVRMLDHFVSRAAARKEKKEPEDYQLLVSDVQRGNLALRMQEKDSQLFPVRLNGLPAAGQEDGTAWQFEELKDLPGGGVKFTLDNGKGIEIYKIYRPRPDHRGISLEIGLRNKGSEPAPQAVLLLELDGPTLINPSEASLFGNPAVAIAVPVGGVATVVHANPAGSPPVQLQDQKLSMAGTTNRFFGAFLFPLDEGAASAVTGMKVLAVPDQEDKRSGTPRDAVPQPVYQLKLPVPPPGQDSKVTFGLYLGPKSFRVFDEQQEHARFLPIMDVDLEPPCCIVVPGARFIATTLLKLLGFFESLVGSWGIAIMMLTVLVRGLLAPLNFRMQKSMRGYASRMAVVKPKMDKIKAQHADDPKAYQAAMMQFQREHKLLPPIGGCLPIFLTMPIYLGLFAALRVAYDLRQQPFMLWIDDLSQPDALFVLGWGSWVPYFNLLPLVWIGMLLWLQTRMPLPTDPQQRQMQMIMRYMPVIFGVLLYNYASGLMVYMITSMVWTMFESAVTKKILGPIDPNVQAMAPTPIM